MMKVRAFIAVEMDAALERGLAEVQRRLKEQVDLPVRWIRTEGIHLTLKFLGDVDAGEIERIEQGLARATASVRPFWISLGRVGGFPSLAKPRVLWVSLEGDLEALAECQRRVEAEMKGLGFPAEERAFQPHLTLGRVRQGGPRGAGLDPARLAGLGDLPEVRQRVEGVSLMRSELKPTGAAYTRLAAFP